MGNKRNGGLDFQKFLFAMAIVFFHGDEVFPHNGVRPFFSKGWMGVEFFFLVSGYFMAASCLRREGPPENLGRETYEFIKGKFLRLIPNIYLGWFITWLVLETQKYHAPPGQMIRDAIHSIPTLLLIQMGGMNWREFLGVIWYLSVMLISMTVLYPLLRKLKDTFLYVIAPVGWVLLAGFLYQNYHTLMVIREWNGFVYSGMIRGTMGILGGCVCYTAARHLREHRYTGRMHTVFAVLEWSLCLGVLACLHFMEESRNEFMILPLVMALVTLSCGGLGLDARFFNKRLFYWLGEYSFSLYLGHTCWRNAQEAIFPAGWGYWEKMGVYLVLALGTGLFIMYASKLLRSAWRRLWSRLRPLLIQTEEGEP